MSQQIVLFPSSATPKEPPKISLRPYQQDAHDAILRELAAGVNRQVISLATGGGKTILFASLIKDLPSPTPRATQVLVLAHRKELVNQNAEKIGWLNPDLKIGIEQGSQYADPDCDVVSATVQTLGREESKRLRKFDPANFKAIIVDEVHHCSEENSTYMRILDYFGVTNPSTDKVLLGFSATVKRADGKGLKHTYDEIVYHKGMREGIEEKWLAPLRAKRIDTATDISNVSVQGGRFVVSELEEAINTDERNQVIYDAWYNYAHSAGRRATLIFCADRKHLWSCVEQFRACGVDARGVDGTTPEYERSEICADFLAGRFPVLVNCAVMTEGTDFPIIDTLIMARPCRSSSLYIQCLGRGTRLPTGYQNMHEIEQSTDPNIKRDCLVLDVVDVCGNHSLVTTPVLFDLRQDFDAEGEDMSFAARKVEEQIAKNPSAALAKTVREAQKIVAEDIDLMSLSEPDEEYAQMSQIRWKQASNGDFFAAIPDTEKSGQIAGNFRLTQNGDDWEVKFFGPTGSEEIVRKRNNLELAFQAADAWIERDFADRMTLLRKNQKWHAEGATDAQKQFLTKLKWPYAETITKIEAAEAINKALMMRKKKSIPNRRKKSIDHVEVGKIN